MPLPNPRSWWTEQAIELFEKTATKLGGWTSDAAIQGRYEDAQTLALIEDAFRTWFETSEIDEAVDRAWERNHETETTK